MKQPLLKKITSLGRAIAKGGWTKEAVHRLIARVEDDGKTTRAEETSLRSLLAHDAFDGGGRRELARYLRFVDHVRSKPPQAPQLIRDGRDVDPERYRRAVEVLAGERAIQLPPRPGRIFLRDRFVPSPRHQLDETLEWLEAEYAKLGIQTKRQPVPWQGRLYANLIATLPGESTSSVVLCDHYDVADKEHLRPSSREQIRRKLSSSQVRDRLGSIAIGEAVPGADDNASATAALLEAGRLLVTQPRPPLSQTLRLVHLVGEELPADCLGARHFLARAREEQEPITAAIVLDMIGVDRSGTRRLQISPGRPAGSLALAAEVKHAIAALGLELCPVLRPHGSRKSFLHQTDAIHFSKAGIPVVLLNEHLNDDHDLYRGGYHDEFDIPALMDFGFAVDVTRAALETAYRVAQKTRPSSHT